MRAPRVLPLCLGAALLDIVPTIIEWLFKGHLSHLLRFIFHITPLVYVKISEQVPLRLSLPYHVKVDQALIDQVLAHGHLFGKVHVRAFPIAQISITRRIAQIARLTDHKLAEFIAE